MNSNFRLIVLKFRADCCHRIGMWFFIRNVNFIETNKLFIQQIFELHNFFLHYSLLDVICTDRFSVVFPTNNARHQHKWMNTTFRMKQLVCVYFALCQCKWPFHSNSPLFILIHSSCFVCSQNISSYSNFILIALRKFFLLNWVGAWNPLNLNHKKMSKH